MPAPTFLEFPDRKTASAAAADHLARALERQLDSGGPASLVVSGGGTPVECLRFLSGTELDWHRVTVLPSDERWVPADHTDSNEAMIRQQLLTGAAGAAHWLPFYRPGLDPATAATAIGEEILALPRPFGAVLLGMGEDGHFASLFPDYDGLGSALDPDSDVYCVPVQTLGSPHPRISLTLAALVDSVAIQLLFFGAAKRRVFDSALNGSGSFPLAALLSQDRTPVTAIWAP